MHSFTANRASVIHDLQLLVGRIGKFGIDFIHREAVVDEATDSIKNIYGYATDVQQ